MNDLRTALKSDDVERIRRSSEALLGLAQKIGAGAPPKDDDGVVEGDRRITLWHPEPTAAVASLPEGVECRSLAAAVHLHTASTSGLIVDWTHVQAGLRDLKENQKVSYELETGRNGKTSAVRFPATAGTTYYISVDGVGGAGIQSRAPLGQTRRRPGG